MNKKLLFVALALSLDLSSKAQVDPINTFVVGQPKVTETVVPGTIPGYDADLKPMDVPMSDFTRSLNYFLEKFTGEDNDYNRSLLLVMNDFLVVNLRERRST